MFSDKETHLHSKIKRSMWDKVLMCLKLKDCHPSKIYIFGERIVSISMEKEKKILWKSELRDSQNWLRHCALELWICLIKYLENVI